VSLARRYLTRTCFGNIGSASIVLNSKCCVIKIASFDRAAFRRLQTGDPTLKPHVGTELSAIAFQKRELIHDASKPDGPVS
jgi:hypothetical protein